LPTNHRIKLQNGRINETGRFITDGTAGYALFGPYEETADGIFEFKLNYSVIGSISNDAGLFDIAVTDEDGLLTVLNNEVIKSDHNSVTVRVNMERGSVFEYRVYTNDGTVIQIESIEITRIS